MAYAVLALTPNPQLRLSPTVTVFSGTAQLGRQGVSYAVKGRPAEDFGFFVPDAPALAEGVEPPQLLAEAALMVSRSIEARTDMGVVQVNASYLADPRGGPARWLHVGGLAHAGFPIQIGYRVTVVAAQPTAE